MARRWKAELAVWAILIGGVTTCVASMPEPPPKTAAELAADKMLSAFIRCENQTESQLADPDGFDPQPYGEWIAVETSDDRHVFRFMARAKNAFGALIWAEFTCEVTYDGASDHWTAVIEQSDNG